MPDSPAAVYTPPGNAPAAPIAPPSAGSASPQNPGLVQSVPGNAPAAPFVPPTAAAATPQNPGLVQSVAGNAPAAPVIPPSPPAAAPQDGGTLVAPPVIPWSASLTLGSGNSAITFLSERPGIDSNTYDVEIDNPEMYNPQVTVSGGMTEYDPSGNSLPPHQYLYIVPGNNPKIVLSGLLQTNILTQVVSSFPGNGDYLFSNHVNGRPNYVHSSGAYHIFWIEGDFPGWCISSYGYLIQTVFMSAAGIESASPDEVPSASWTGRLTGTASLIAVSAPSTAGQIVAAVNAGNFAVFATAGGNGTGATTASSGTLTGGVGLGSPPAITP